MSGHAQRARGRPPLGQHFLRSSALAAALVRCAGVEPGDLVVDVGAGRGALTRALAQAGARVLAVELDPTLADLLRRDGFSVDEIDARQLRWPSEPFAVVASLPFDPSGEILRNLLTDPRLPLRRADVIVEWEVGRKRAAAWPSTLQGVLWGAWYQLELALRIDRSAFSPPPRVDAGLLRAVRRTQPLVASSEARRFAAFVGAGFRRGELRRALAPWLTPRRLRRLAPELGFPPDAHARDLAPEQWAALYRSVFPNR